jgi:hypothetical protein
LGSFLVLLRSPFPQNLCKQGLEELVSGRQGLRTLGGAT